jgi:hypothetical protein
MRTLSVTLLLAACAALARPADAFLLLRKAKDSGHDATTVIVLREAERTVLSVQPHYRGPAEPVLLVVPLPGTVGSDAIGAAVPAPFELLDRLSAPRLAELWEQDPCSVSVDLPGPPEDASEADAGAPGAPSAPASAGAGAGPYELKVSSAKTGHAMVEWMNEEGFKVPEGAEPLMEQHIRAGGTFLLAKLDGSKLGLEGEQALLPPLRMTFDAKELTLPSRLAALSGGGKHELEILVLGPGARYEASNAPNLAVPTNLDVKPAVRRTLGPFYQAVLEHAFDQHPDAVLTEYAWRATSCDPCPGRALSDADFPLLGSDLLTSAAVGAQHEVLVDASGVSSRPGGPEPMRAKLGDCYLEALAAEHGLGGEVVLQVQTGPSGEVASTTVTGAAKDTLGRCATEALRGAVFDKKQASGTVRIRFAARSRAFDADWVFTRLRARYGKVPESDLVLRAGRPIEGGRELGPNNEPEQRVYQAAVGDNFQPRYVIRHPFKGKIECESPKRGVWGGRPPSEAAADDAKKDDAKKDDAKKDDGAAKKGKPAKPPKLDSLLAGKLPDLAAYEMHFAPGTERPAPTAAPAPTVAPSASTAPPSAPSGSATPAGAPPAQGCGCTLARRSAAPLAGLMLALLGLGVRSRGWRRSRWSPGLRRRPRG